MADLGITMDASGWLSNQGRFAAGRPQGVVVHTLECEAKPRIAQELSAQGGYLDNEGLAPQRMTDPTSIVRTIPDGTKGGHCGQLGNPRFVGVEVSGRASWSRAQWLDGGLAQAALSNSARAAAGLFIVYGHGLDEIRWLSGAQIKAGNEFGLLGHVDVSVFVGGTNHWDPGLPADFPYDWYAAEVRRWFLIMTGASVDTDWWDEMSDAEKAQLLADVAEIKARLRGSDPNVDSLQALSMGLTAANRGITSIGTVVGDALGPVTDAGGNKWPFKQAIASMADRIYRLATDAPKA